MEHKESYYNRLSDLFMDLDLEELREVAKYLRSPLFNQQEKLVELFDYMRKRRHRGWKNENIHKQLFPDEVFNIKKLHSLNSALFRKIESYLAWKEWKRDGVQQELHLLRAYRKKHRDKSFDRVMKNTEEKLKESASRNADYLHSQYLLHQEQFHHYRERGRSVEFNLQELSNAQDIYYIAEKLKHACTILSHQAMYKKEYDQDMLPAALELVNKNPSLLNHTAIAVYYHAHIALSDNSREDAFRLLVESLKTSIKQFSDIEQRDIYILAINFCIRKINSGQKNFMREVFHLYQSGLKDEVFIENGILSRWTYNNIIVAALKLKEFNWAENFIYSYKNQLDEKTREDSFNFNLAKFYFEKKDYQKTMPLLIQTKYDDLLHNLGAKTMLAKMYYELEEWDALENLLDSFKIYIQRKKDIGYHKENYMNIISFIKKLVQINSFDKSNLKQLREQIITTPVLTEREWLLKRLGENS